MKEIAVSLRVNFEADGLTANHYYRMEQALQTWLQNLVADSDTNALHESLVAAARKDITEFFVFVLSDLTTAKLDALAEEACAEQRR